MFETKVVYHYGEQRAKKAVFENEHQFLALSEIHQEILAGLPAARATQAAGWFQTGDALAVFFAA